MAGGDSGAGPEAGPGRRWDVALSFAGAQRDYVGQVAAALKARGIRCFYDADEKVRLWGTHLAEELPRIYAQESAAVVVFISADYAGPGWTLRRAALARAVAEAGVYVLPARFDDSQLPGLLPDVGTVDLRRYTPEQFAGLVAEKVAELAGGPRPEMGPAAAAGRLLAEVIDPFALEVHRPVQSEDAEPGLPELPAYVPREHDRVLAEVVRAAADGRSSVAVLVGGSSTGKTRACWEAVALLRNQDLPWQLWHPIDPTRPDAALRALSAIGSRTVVWLNEAQLYLDVTEAGLGERVAAGLRELLRDPARAPVLVLATLWPEFWDRLTAPPAAGDADPHAQARELLAGRDITVPAAFTKAQLRRLSQAEDARLTQAAAGAQDGQVIQFLAGTPELLARYRNAPPAAAALIHAAMDARRLGMGIGLPHAFLEAAAPGYLTDTEWDALGEDWLEQALAYAAAWCKGVRGPLTRIRPRPARSGQIRPSSRKSDEQLAGGQSSIPTGPLYRLADYLDQYGRRHRNDQIPPTGFWAAAADHASPGDQATLGDAAHARGLYHAAAQLHKNAAARGNLHAAFYLSHSPRYLRADVRPVRWAAAHIRLDDPDAVARLLGELRKTGARGQATVLLRRDPAARVRLHDPHAVARLLGELQETGAQDQVTALAARAAARVPLDNPGAVARLLSRLRKADAQDQVTVLADRAAAHVRLDDPLVVAELLGRLRETRAQDQVTALLRRDPAAHVPLRHPGAVACLLGRLREAGAPDQVTALLRRDPAARVRLEDPRAVAALLGRLREAGAPDQVTVLARRAAAHFPLEDPRAVARLLGRLREAGAPDQATVLADRAAAHVSLEDPRAVARLLGELREAGAPDQATVLARRAAAHVRLEDPGAVARLLGELREAGAPDQVTALARRAAAHVRLEDPRAVAWLLDGLRKAGAPDQATALLRRDPAAHVSLEDPRAVARLLGRLREAGAPDQATVLARRAAAHVRLEDPGAVAWLLRELREAGAPDQVTVLARRAAAHVRLEDPGAVAALLDGLWEAGAEQQVAALLRRDPAAHVPLDDPGAVAALLDGLREAGAEQQVTALLRRDPAAHVPLRHPGAVAALLGRLREAGAPDQATALADRLPEAGMFELFREQEDHRDRFRFGREADGSPAEPWDWEDLD